LKIAGKRAIPFFTFNSGRKLILLVDAMMERRKRSWRGHVRAMYQVRF